MTEDQDNAGEVVAATVRVALTAAGQLAEQAARRREAALRDAERTSAAQVATLQAQLAAERQAAMGSVQDVLRRGDTASVEDFTQAWHQIRSWDDPGAVASRFQLRELVWDRFGVEPDSLTGGRTRRSEQLRTPERDASVGATVLPQDTAGQREDAGRGAASVADRLAALTSPLEDAGVDSEVAYARALAAQSHPTAPAMAAQPPATTPRAQPRVGKRLASIEVQTPGR